LVVYLFLQDFKSTLIPAIGAVAIIGTFFFLQYGFSTMLTLFAMILAIGIVVDDAIVVVEAVHAKLDEGAKSAKGYSFCNERNLGEYLDYTCNVSGIYSCLFLSGPAGFLPTVCSNFGHCYFDFGR
jgi:HAE1 family hydrophobic/amphiphilic exporter-1